MTARELPAGTISARGLGLGLEPLDEGGLRELWPVIGVPEVFGTGFMGGLPALPADEDAFVAFMRANLPDGPDDRSWLVRDAAGRAVGMSSLGHVDRAREAAEIGWTAYAPSAWGTFVNPACKLALFGVAFEHGFGKVVLNVDGVNERSLGAVARLGAVREGVLRRDRQRPDGSWRDTVTHSVLAAEWPGVRAGLEARLASLGAPDVGAAR